MDIKNHCPSRYATITAKNSKRRFKQQDKNGVSGDSCMIAFQVYRINFWCCRPQCLGGIHPALYSDRSISPHTTSAMEWTGMRGRDRHCRLCTKPWNREFCRASNNWWRKGCRLFSILHSTKWIDQLIEIFFAWMFPSLHCQYVFFLCFKDEVCEREELLWRIRLDRSYVTQPYWNCRVSPSQESRC